MKTFDAATRVEIRLARLRLIAYQVRDRHQDAPLVAQLLVQLVCRRLLLWSRYGESIQIRLLSQS